jgi:AAA ATPase-like protein
VTTVEIVARDEELRSIEAFLERTSEEPAALVLEGEAGIGKSTLWRAAVEEANAQAARVLSSSPAEAERGLAFAGLGDLLEPVLHEVLPSLPPPRRRALETVLLLEEAEEPVDPRALGVAVRTALELLGSEGPPLVLAVDDVQWLDPSSASALAFALRRLREQPVLLLLARRLDQGAERSELERAIDAERVVRLRVGPRRFFTVDVDVTNLLDLRVSEHRDAVALDLDALRGPWEPCSASASPPTSSVCTGSSRPPPPGSVLRSRYSSTTCQPSSGRLLLPKVSGPISHPTRAACARSTSVDVRRSSSEGLTTSTPAERAIQFEFLGEQQGRRRAKRLAAWRTGLAERVAVSEQCYRGGPCVDTELREDVLEMLAHRAG